jgi:hypothetical protein
VLDERANQWLTEPTLKRACRRASSSIRQRMGAGGLSLAQARGGELSAPVEAGELSEPD